MKFKGGLKSGRRHGTSARTTDCNKGTVMVDHTVMVDQGQQGEA